MKRFVPLLVLGLGLGLSVQAQAADARAGSPLLAQGTPAPGAPPQVCTENYQPVCGTSPSGTRVTYSNACFARAAMATNVMPGECGK